MNHLVIAVKTTQGGRWILPQIKEARARDLRVTVITPPGEGRLVDAVRNLAEQDRGVQHQPAPFDFTYRPPWRAVVGLWRLRRLLVALRPDAVLYHLYATALAVRLATLGLRVRKVHMVAGPLYLDSALLRSVERLLARRDDLVICGSQYTRTRYARLGLPPARLVTIPYGVDTEHYRPPREPGRSQAREALGLRPDYFVVAMVAYVYAPKSLVHRGEGIKGHRILLEAWMEFHRRHPDAELLLVGGGFDARGETYRRQLVGRYGGSAEGLLAQGVHWLNSVDDVRQAYLAADVSVSPSLSDNHGAVLEASAMAVPSIVSDAGALPEGVRSGAGWVFRRGRPQELLRCLEDAYSEGRAGTLPARGLRARSFMVAAFDAAELTRSVLDVVCGSTDVQEVTPKRNHGNVRRGGLAFLRTRDSR